MRYWWVNQNQTYEQERDGNYLWSPKRKADGSRNPFYEFMREVSPGDVIFSFQGTRIRAMSIAQSSAYECPKPDEFGNVGENWGQIGWKVDARYFGLRNQIRPADHLERIRPLLPAKYAPIQRSGRGNQGVYLTEIMADFATELISMIGSEARALIQANRVADRDRMVADALGQMRWEEQLTKNIRESGDLRETEKEAIVLARRGQGLFKKNVCAIEHACRVTKVDRLEHLRASHCKPWRDCDNAERLDGENGLLLTPTIDHLFDRGFISFEDTGRLLISPTAHIESMRKMQVPVDEEFHAGSFSEGQKRFLDYHRENIFLEARVSL